MHRVQYKLQLSQAKAFHIRQFPASWSPQVQHRGITFSLVQINAGTIDYVPFHKALVLEGQTEEGELREDIEELQKFVSDRFNNIADALEV